MGINYQIPSWIQRLYRGVVFRGDIYRKVVYLTFDDGPVPEVTPRLLDILREKDVPATFFMVGENAERYPDLVRRVLAEGHRIGNHTYNHLRGTKYSVIEYIANVVKADKVLNDTRLFRPPYGRLTADEKSTLLAQGYTIFLWDVLTHDYNAKYSPEKMLKIVQRYTRNGSIINFHDSVKSGERTLAVVPQVIDWLRGQGYVFEDLKI